MEQKIVLKRIEDKYVKDEVIGQYIVLELHNLPPDICDLRIGQLIEDKDIRDFYSYDSDEPHTELIIK